MKQNVIYLLFFVTLSHPSKINTKIIKCLTKEKSKGFCREASECVGAKVPLISKNCPTNFICCPVREVSRTKCYEYSKAVFAKSPFISVFFDEKKQELSDHCGIVTGIPLSVGGEKTFPKEFPHMAALGYKDKEGSESTWDCGGSLISELYILTAAHCCSKKKSPKVVKLGAVDINSNETNVQLRKIQKVIVHPKYVKKSGIHFNDVALLRMNKEVNFTPFVRPICLDYKGRIDYSKVLAIGYGVTFNGGNGSPNLLKAVWDIINKKDCTLSWKKTYKTNLPGNKFCAGSVLDGSDKCLGDSGGNLQVILKKPYCMFSQVALSSSAGFCGYNHSIYVFSRVFSYIPWIESVVWPEEN